VTGMSDENGTHTSTTGAPVGADLDGLDFKEDWKYSSVVGMLITWQQIHKPILHMQYIKLQSLPIDLSILMLSQSSAEYKGHGHYSASKWRFQVIMLCRF